MGRHEDRGTATLDDPFLLPGAAELIADGRCVLFDFDGPLCRLFPDDSSAPLADALRRIVARSGALDLLPPGAMVSIDPHAVLRAVDLARPGSDLVAELEACLVEGERAAARTAPPTPGADRLVRRLWKAGAKIAVTTNNAPEAVSTYLRRAGLYDCFAGPGRPGGPHHVYGRTDDPRLLKPHPDCLHRALSGLRAKARDALMFGDTATDLAAAHAAGVAFVGYARDEDEAKVLWEAGADLVLSRFDHLADMIAL